MNGRMDGWIRYLYHCKEMFHSGIWVEVGLDHALDRKEREGMEGILIMIF